MTSIPKPLPKTRTSVLGFSQYSKPNENRGLQNSRTESPSLLGYKTEVRSAAPPTGNLVKSLSSIRVSGTVVERLSQSSIVIFHGSTGHMIEATDTASAVEALRGIAKTDSDSGFRTRLLFRRGFSEDETIGYMDSLRVKLAGEVEGGVEIEALSTEQMTRIARDTDFDYAAAQITEETPVDVGADLVKQSLTVEVPSKIAAKPSLRLRISLLLKRSLGSIQARVAEAKDIIVTAFRDFGSSGTNDPIISAASQLKTRLTKRFGDDVRVHIIDQASDVLITERTTAYGRCERDCKAA